MKYQCSDSCNDTYCPHRLPHFKRDVCQSSPCAKAQKVVECVEVKTKTRKKK